MILLIAQQRSFKHTSVHTAPGFCTLSVFTTWNTSTTPSILHWSILVAMAQNMPQRLTVSLQKDITQSHPNLHVCTHVMPVYLQCTTMGWLLVFLCTPSTISITLMMVLSSEQLPSAAQLVM